MEVRAWLRLHLFDVITLVLGTVLALRFWYLFFGVGDRRLIAILTVIATADVGKRLVLACRRMQRPQLFCGDRCADLLAALALGAAPWPIAVPANAASMLWALGLPLAQAAWLGPLMAMIVVAAALRSLFST